MGGSSVYFALVPLVCVALALDACGNGVGTRATPNGISEALMLDCAATPAIAVQGTAVQVTASASGAESTPTYSYSASSGTISGTGPATILDTSLAVAGAVTVTCRAQDGGGQSALSTTQITVVAATNDAYYIATNGDDSADGSAAHPFRTLMRTQTAMQGSRIKTAILEAGTFYLTDTLKLSGDDQGETWRALDGAPVVLSGGEVLSGWQSAGKGIYSTTAPHPVWLDLTIAGVRQTAADLGYDPDRPFITGWRVVAPTVGRNTGTTIGVLADDLTASVKPGATVQLLSDRRYTDTFTSIISVDRLNHAITLADAFSGGAANGASWRVLADLADLTIPGEFAYDRTAGKVYVMPMSQATIDADAVVAAQLSTLIALDNCFRHHDQRTDLQRHAVGEERICRNL